MAGLDLAIQPGEIQTRRQLVVALQGLRGGSSLSYNALAKRIDTPRSTVHGWFTGKHLPFQRDNHLFEAALVALGVTDTEPWLLALRRVRLAPVPLNPNNPYQGLAPYTEGDADLFFGRGELIAELVARVTTQEIGSYDCPIVLLGPSGSGKSSLIRAGVLPRVRTLEGWVISHMTPGDDPIRTLSAAVQALEQVEGAAARILFVDQFEELYQGTNDSARDSFLHALEAFERNAPGRVVIGLRADFFHRAALNPWLLSGLRRQIIVEPPALSDVPTIIKEPAGRVGLVVDPKLQQALVADFGSHVAGHNRTATALPLLSHVLWLIADQAAEATALEFESYERLGGLEAALENSAEASFALLDANGRAHCEQLFKSLIDVDDEALPTRREVRRSDLQKIHGADFDLDALVSTFAETRLIIADVDTVRISHEALLTAWGRLSRWVDEERSVLAGIWKVRTAAAVWTQAAEDPTTLLSGAQLVEATTVVNRIDAPQRLTADQRRFVASSATHRSEQIRRDVRRKRLAFTTTAILAILAVLAGVTIVRSARASDRAEAQATSRQLALRAVSLSKTDSSLSRQMAIAAYDEYPTVEGLSALLDASAEMASARYLGGPGATALGVAAQSGRVAVSSAPDGTITILDPGQNGLARAFTLDLPDPEQETYALALSEDGRYLFSGGTDLYVSMWDLDGDRSAAILDDSKTLFGQAIQSIVVDDDAGLVYGSGTGGGIGVWDLDGTPQSESQLLPDEASIMRIALDSSSGLLASASMDGEVKLRDLNGSEAFWADTVLDGHAAFGVAISDGGDLLAAGYRHGLIRVWDISNRDEVIELEIPESRFRGSVNVVAFGNNDTLLAVGTTDGTVELLSTDGWTSVATIPQSTVVTNIAFHTETEMVLTIADGSIRTVDLEDLALDPMGSSIWSVSFSSDGTRMLAASASRAAVWDTSAGVPAPALAQTYPQTDVVFGGASDISPSGALAAFGSVNGQIVIVEVDATERFQVLAELEALVQNVAFSNDNRLLAGVDDDGRGAIWQISDDGSALFISEVSVEGKAFNLAFNHDNTALAVTAETGDVSVFDVSEPAEPTLSATFSTGTSFGLAVAFHPTLELLATGNADGSVEVWDLSDLDMPMRQVRDESPNSRIFSVDFNSDGSRLAAAVGDTTAWLWSVTEQSQIGLDAVLTAPDNELYTIQFSPDGTYLIGGGAGRRLFRWAADPAAARAEICATIGDPITEGEWALLVPSRPFSQICKTGD